MHNNCQFIVQYILTQDSKIGVKRLNAFIHFHIVVDSKINIPRPVAETKTKTLGVQGQDLHVARLRPNQGHIFGSWCQDQEVYLTLLHFGSFTRLYEIIHLFPCF